MSSEAAVFEGVSESHQEQLLAIMRFFSGKQDMLAQALDGDFEDCTTDALHGDDMYNKEDVEGILARLNSTVEDSMRNESRKLINMSVRGAGVRLLLAVRCSSRRRCCNRLLRATVLRPLLEFL